MKWALLIGVVATIACHPHPPPAPVRQTNLGLQIEYLELGNGLKVVLVEDPKASQIQTTMRYRVGAADDPAGQEGMAHLVEHLMFQQVLGGQSLFDQLENITSSFNGTTSLDATTYLSRAKGEHLEKLLSIEAVRLGFRCTTITDAVFDREREVVINELRQRSPGSATYLAVQSRIYPVGHPYARLPSGTEETLRAITREQACKFADAHYAPSNAALVISGDITRQVATAALQKFLAKLPKRTASAPLEVAAPVPRRVEMPGPVDSPILVIGWPLPSDPKQRSQARTVLDSAVSWIDFSVKGLVVPVTFGDQAARLTGVAIELTDGETSEQVLEKVATALTKASLGLQSLDRIDLGAVVYDRIRQTAVHRIFSQLEDGSDRDIILATEVLAGRDPRLAIASELEGLRGLSRETMGQVVDSTLQVDHASILTLTPEATAPHAKAAIAAPVHDQGQRRDPPDPALAQQPIVKELGGRGFAAMRTRTLPNGLTVVLLPIASVPTVDIRIVFRAGGSDDPRDASGAAKVAGHGLALDPDHLNDLLLFHSAGGRFEVDVGRDHVAFGVRGMEMHLDALLAGLRRWVVEGQYNSDTEAVARALRNTIKEGQSEGALSDAWAAAIYGNHAYAKFGSPRQLSAGLSGADGKAFHDAYLTPDNATLVIAGGFDPVLADRWIDFLFQPWSGKAAVRTEEPSEFRRVSLAHDEPADQTLIRLAFPVTSKSHAQQLVIAEILAIIVGDVRHQLGASYGVAASLDDARLGPRYVVAGYIETARLAEAMKLIHDRLDQLHDDPEEAARMFVTARQRVITRASSLSSRPSELCAQIIDDVAHHRPPLSALTTAQEVQKLTISALNLYELDADNAALLMRGPRASLDPAFSAFGRIATYVTAPAETAVPEVAPSRPLLTNREGLHLEPPLTFQGERNPFGFIVGASYGVGRAFEGALDGFHVTARVSYKLDRRTSVAVGFTIGNFDGQARLVEDMAPVPIEMRTISVNLGLQTTFFDRGWAGAFVGLHADRLTVFGANSHTSNAGAELIGGIDLYSFGANRLGIFGRLDAAPTTDASFNSFTAGLAYRRVRL